MSTQDQNLIDALLPAAEAATFKANLQWRQSKDADVTAVSYIAELLLRGMAIDTLAAKLAEGETEVEFTPPQALTRMMQLNDISRGILRDMSDANGILDDLGEHAEVLMGIVGNEIDSLVS